MSISVRFNSAHMIPFASEFFMARRPILDAGQHLVAHELLFCHVASDDLSHPDTGGDGPSTASVISDVMQHGLVKIIGDVTAYLEMDAEALMSDTMADLPHGHVVLAIMESTRASPSLLARIDELAQRGFTFALDACCDSEDVQKLLPLVGTIKINVRNKTPAQLAALCAMFKEHNKKMLAEGVDTVDRFEECVSLGFDWFQGYYFSRPQIMEGKKLAPSHLAITELMALIASDADSADIEHSIKSDVTLGLNLLRLVNTPAISPHRIDSLRQALMVLGRDQLQRWLQIMLYADAGGGAARPVVPLLMLATTRGRLLELVAQKLRPGNRSIADTAFTVGIMSLMDTLFSMPMEEILQQIMVVEDVSDALLHRKGFFGTLLRLAEQTELVDKDGAQLQQITSSLRLAHNDLYVLQRAAYEWSDHVSRSLH